MTFKSNNKAAYTADGIPYLWNSGDVTTIPSNETKILASDGASGDFFGISVAIGSGRIVVGAHLDDDAGTSSGSAYIFDLDGNQLTKITASDAAAGDRFGYSVAIGSGRIVVGAHLDGDAGTSSGSAYIFDLDGNQLTKITASDAAAGDRFGYSVAVGSGRIVVGAYLDDDKGPSSGSAYIFDLNGNEIAKITASDGADGDNFGISVAIGSGRIVVGADANDDIQSSSGSAYIFDLNGNEIAKITASDPINKGVFGVSVAAGSGRIVVGAQDEDGATPGSAYIFDLDGNQLNKISSSDGANGDRFGTSVAIGLGRIVVGAYADDDAGSSSGSAYIFDLDGNELTKITASDQAGGDRFGSSVAIGSGRIVVASNQNDDNGTNAGSAYIYETPQVYNLYDAIELRGKT